MRPSHTTQGFLSRTKMGEIEKQENPSKEEPVTEEPERDQWGAHCDFLLSCLGYAVGLGNIWRFPYLCYKNGGGSFLVPYIIMLFTIGLPLFFFELGLGQYAGIGPARLFGKLYPASVGVGWGMVIVAFLVVIYYNMIIAWTLYYMYAGFTPILPWTECGVGSSQYCYSKEQDIACLDGSNQTEIYYNGTCIDRADICKMFNADVLNSTHCDANYGATVLPLDLKKVLNRRTESEDYFSHQMLGLKDESTWENMGHFQPHLIVTLVVAWFLVFISLIKGVKSSGKVVYFTALYPYAILVVLFVRGVTLPGAIDGINWYITPDWDKLFEIGPWGAAATQLFYSLGMSFGTLLTFAGYNKFENNCLRDALLVSFANCSTSIFSGFVIFSIVGFMAKEIGVPVSEVIQSGPGLTFIAYPAALSYLPISPLWSFLFFSMILTLGLDSQFAMTETVTTAIMDQWPVLRSHVSKVVFGVCATCCLCGLPFCLNGGIFIFELFNVYSAMLSLLVLALAEVVLVCWCYGMDDWINNLLEMGVRLSFSSWYWKLTLKVLAPIL